MPITLTCSCCQQQNVANSTAGQKFACVTCGKTLTVPAMGVLASAKAKAKPPVKLVVAPSPRRLGWVFIAAGFLLLLAIGIGWLAWSLTREKPNEPQQIVQNVEADPNDKRRIEPSPSIERKRGEPEKKEPTALIDGRPSEKKQLPNRVIEPVKPKPKGLPVVEKKLANLVEPVKQFDELPNPFLLPIKPEPPLKVVDKEPANLIEPLKLVWKLKADDTFFQELVVTQRPTFKVQGLPIVSMLQYRIVSRFTVKKRNENGSLGVEQKIEWAKLLQADELTKPTLAGAIARMPGTTFKLELSPKMDVTKFEGVMADPKATAFGGGLGMQMTSLLDRDGWKELAQATFFQMDQPLKLGAKWSKPMTHNWGSLGSWSGRVHYVYAVRQANLHKIAYGLQLKYKVPAGGAVGLMKITGATFQPQQAEGAIFFDSVKGKVTHAEERFRVKSVINANLLGQNTMIEIEEDQYFLIRIHDKLDAVK